MSVRSDLELGVRLAIAGGRSALARLLLIASGISLGVGLLLSVVGIFPAEAAVERRAAARQFEVVEGDQTPPADHVLLDYAETTFGEQPIAITYMAPVGRPSTPPWLDALPQPGEIVVSPDLAELLASPDGALLRPRLPGEVVDVLNDRWLLHPGELVAYVGAARDDLSPHPGDRDGLRARPGASRRRVHLRSRDRPTPVPGLVPRLRRAADPHRRLRGDGRPTLGVRS